MRTRYILPIHVCSIRAQKKSEVKNEKKCDKYKFRILKKQYAYLQIILNAPVKFEKDWPQTVGGVAGKRMVGALIHNTPPHFWWWGIIINSVILLDHYQAAQLYEC